MRRRRVLAGAGLLIAGTAGCTVLTGETDTPESTDAVESYFDAIGDDNRTNANQFAHPDGEYYLEDDEHPSLGVQNLTLTTTETVDIEQAVRAMFEAPEEVDIEAVVTEEEAAVEDIKAEYGFSEYAYVRHDATADDFTFNSVLLLFEGDDGWVIWSPPTTVQYQ